MDFIQPKIVNFFKKNIEIFLLIFLLIISTFITQFYNHNAKKVQKNYLEILRNSYFKKSLNYFFSNLKPKFENIEYKIENGDTLADILTDLSIDKKEIQKVIVLLKKNNAENLIYNQTLKLTLENSANFRRVSNILIPVTKSRKLEVFKIEGQNTFNSREIITNLEKKLIFKEGVIKSSLYKSATQENINPNVIIEFARLYGFQIDFQRDIRKNDSFQLIYEVFVDENGVIFENGNIIYANLILRGQYNQLYYFPKKKFNGHYDENGKSIKKALMKTPNGARLPHRLE